MRRRGYPFSTLSFQTAVGVCWKRSCSVSDARFDAASQAGDGSSFLAPVSTVNKATDGNPNTLKVEKGSFDFTFLFFASCSRLLYTILLPSEVSLDVFVLRTPSLSRKAHVRSVLAVFFRSIAALASLWLPKPCPSTNSPSAHQAGLPPEPVSGSCTIFGPTTSAPLLPSISFRLFASLFAISHNGPVLSKIICEESSK